MTRSRLPDAPAAEPRMAGAEQPARRSFGLHGRRIGPGGAPCRERELDRGAFASTLEFGLDDGKVRPTLAIASPVSGHFPFVMRDLVAALLPAYRVLVADWRNPRHVPLERGTFGLDANVDAVLAMLRRAGPGAHCLGLCQGGVAALAAAALLAEEGDPATPAALALMAAPIDPWARPTRISTLLRAARIEWFERVAAAPVPARHAGRGRRVYPAALQLSGFRAFMLRDAMTGGEMMTKLVLDDGLDAGRFPFLDLYTSVMDLDLAFVVEHTRAVFQRRGLMAGALSWRGRAVAPEALADVALVTLEGGRDRVAAPGQTAAAHALCPAVPEARRARLVFGDCGHFSLFHGERCRREVAPALIRAMGA